MLAYKITSLNIFTVICLGQEKIYNCLKFQIVYDMQVWLYRYILTYINAKIVIYNDIKCIIKTFYVILQWWLLFIFLHSRWQEYEVFLTLSNAVMLFCPFVIWQNFTAQSYVTPPFYIIYLYRNYTSIWQVWSKAVQLAFIYVKICKNFDNNIYYYVNYYLHSKKKFLGFIFVHKIYTTTNIPSKCYSKYPTLSSLQVWHWTKDMN